MVGNLSKAVALSLLVALPPSHAQDAAFPVGCLQMFPEAMQAKIEMRDRQLAQAITNAPGGFAPQFVLTRLKLWDTGQTIKIAFNGGSYQLRKQVAEAADTWTQHANLKFDFGHNPAQMQFREWTEQDTAFAADIRISFHFQGYWSLVGTDSNNAFIVSPNEPSLNLGGFHLGLPSRWKATVLHEFGHALAFQHEHQHPVGGCDLEFRWTDDPGYIPTTDQFGQFIKDTSGRRPGIYTVLGGPPNNWPQAKVDFNLRQLTNSSAYHVSAFDAKSIMKYFFDEWMFTNGTMSSCFNGTENVVLSEKDIEGVKTHYPQAPQAIAALNREKMETTAAVLNAFKADVQQKSVLRSHLEALRSK